jgi:hypothetical protein
MLVTAARREAAGLLYAGRTGLLPAQRFYDRPENQDAYLRHPDPSLAPPELKEPPELDFHQALAILGDHPVLLRKLGIILDLDAPRGAAPG